MTQRRITFLLLIIWTSLPILNTRLAAQERNNLQLENEIEIRLNFHCYHCSIDWNALADLKNNSILNACLTSATYSELQQLGLEDLSIRLQKLQNGNVIKKTGNRYHLAFPAIVGEKRAKFQQLVEQTASELLPTSEQTIQQILPHLEQRNEMLYHVFWSIVMDGAAWITVETELGKQLSKDNVSISGISWVMYPNHPYDCGTNTYSDLQAGKVKITWSTTTASTPSAPWVLYETIKKYDSQLTQLLTTGQPIKNQQARQDLVQYGLVDDKGQLTAYVINANSQAAQVFYQLGLEFGRKAMAHLDVQKIVDLLDVTPEQALVISYHELCYEILKQSAEKGFLQVPEILLNPAKTTQTRLLVSFIRLNGSNPLK